MSIYSNVSALNAFATGIHGSAYNIANISTDGFNPVAVHYRSAVPEGSGVRAYVTRPTNLPDMPNRPAMPPDIPVDVVNISYRAEAPFNPSGTELEREIPTMMLNQRSFEANAAVIRTYEDMSGVVVNMIV